MFKSATMCSGIGSPEQAIKELASEPENVFAAEHENVFACEKDKFARQTYLANFTPGIMYHDMTTEQWDLPEQYADLIVAGIPCQSFSLAGKRLGEKDPRGLLIYDFIRYVKNQRPKVFIIENVKGLLSDDGGRTISRWKDLLGRGIDGGEWLMPNPESCGYNLHLRVLNCKDYGLPQNRERVFLIGIRPDLPNIFRWPKPERLELRLIDLLETVVDEKYFLSEDALKYLTNDNNIGNWSDRLSMLNHSDSMVSGAITANHAKGVPYNMLQVTNRIAGYKETENAIRGVKKDGSGVQEAHYNKPNGISQTISKSHKPKVIQLNPSKESGGIQPYQQNRIYDSDGISPALDGKAGIYGIKVPEATKQGFSIAENGDSVSLKHANSKTRRGRVGKQIANTVDTTEDCVVDNYRIRRYTPLECMRLMGFPDSFVKPCSETQQYKMAGNSIPVHMMKAILRQLLPILNA